MKNNITNTDIAYGGMQQIGIGVHDIGRMQKFYKEVLGFDIPMFEEDGEANLMLPYTGGRGVTRKAALMANLYGGAALEIWQHTEHTPQVLEHEVGVNDLGILCPYIRCVGIDNVRRKIMENTDSEISQIYTSLDNTKRCYVRDVEYNWVGLVETGEGWFLSRKKISHAFSKHSTVKENIVGGVCGVLIGVSDMENSLEFYQKVCGYDTIVYDETRRFEDFDIFYGQQNLRRVMLKRSKKNLGVFAHLLQNSFIELIQTTDRVKSCSENQARHLYRDYKERFWGDPGCIHICFDVKDMDILKAYCTRHDYEFTVDTGNAKDFIMDEAAGRFAYLEDPDRTLIEFVEVYKLPIFKKIGFVLNLRKRKTPLSKCLIRLFALKKNK